MADPRLLTPSQRRANLSPLMEAKAKQQTGEKVNACPFGCEQEDLDDNGYCDHLVGFSHSDKIGVKMDAMIRDEVSGLRKVDSGIEAKTQKGDRFERITCDFRVYRNIPVEKKPVEE